MEVFKAMMNLFFPSASRITRKHYWYSVVGFIVLGIVVSLIYKILAVFIPNQSTEEGSFSVTGVGAIPYIVVGLGSFVFEIVSGFKIARRRLHDRNKSGWFMLIDLIPIVGTIWYVVEVGFLPGTRGPNRYGPPPGSDLGAAAGVGYSTAV